MVLEMEWKEVKRARDRLSREKGTIVKDWGGKLAVALIYPNSYFIGMSNLGFQTVYRLFNEDDSFVCERAFVDRKGQPLLALESQRPLLDFPVLAFSISYELDYFHVVQTLKALGIPLFASQREEGHPLVIAGGPCITANPEPLAPFFDAMAIGEGEVIVPSLRGVLGEGLGGSRQGLLGALARLPGVYVPQAEKGRVQRQWLRDLSSEPAASVIITEDTELGGMYLLEAARGCGRGCRFCLAGFVFRPFRPFPLEDLRARAEEGLRRGGRVGLLGAAVADHPHLEELVAFLGKRGERIAISSLRLDNLTPRVLEVLARGNHTITLAPEAGSQALRTAINKGLSREAVLEGLALVGRYRFPQVKLYFMVGLPGETDEDIRALVELVKEAADMLQKGRTHLVINLSPFVPKAGTPFQGLAMAPPAVIGKRLGVIRKGLAGLGVEVKAESPRESLIQGVLALGDSTLAPLLASVKGSSLSQWGEQLEKGGWLEFPLQRRSPPFPWGHISSGVEEGYLERELARAEKARATPPCPVEGCTVCGVC